MLSMHLVHLQLVYKNQKQDGGSGATTSDDEFSAMGITYQVSDDLTIGYHASERQFGDKTARSRI